MRALASRHTRYFLNQKRSLLNTSSYTRQFYPITATGARHPLLPYRTMSTSPTENEDTKLNLRYIDIGINLTDPVFRGSYHGKQAHEDDLDAVLARATKAGVEKLMVTGSDLAESIKAVELAKSYPSLCYATIGIHPCSAQTFHTHPSGPTSLLSSLRTLATSASASGHCIAYGEIGLDYDRLSLCPKETQLEFFAAQLDLAVELQLPLFLHSRAAAQDFERVLRPRLERLRGAMGRVGVVHSFTGTLEELHKVLEMGLDVGVNGCSLKTQENLDVVKAIPLDRIQLETDGPWCEIRPSHAGFLQYLKGRHVMETVPRAVKKEKWNRECLVKGRNEPCLIGLVACVVAGVKGVDVQVVCEAAWRNSVRMFGFGGAGREMIGGDGE